MRDVNKDGSRIIVSGEGVFIFDSDGNKLLDGMAGLWCVQVGYGRTEIVDAIKIQLDRLPYYNTFLRCSHPSAIKLSEMLADLSPQNLNNIFYTNSGSEANDTVIRIVRTYWKALNKPSKSVIISRKNAYHGSTIGAASLGGMSAMHEQGAPPISGIEHINQPYWFEEGQDLDPAIFGEKVALELEELIETIGVDKIAAFIAEPIQGAGGVIVPPESYWPKIKQILKKYEILFIADEVICGFGRTGHWFGFEKYGLVPDLVSIAKGLSSGYLPIAGVMVSDRISEVIKNRIGVFSHGFTYSGHPAACAAAIANLEVLQRDRIIEYVKDVVGPYFQAQLHGLLNHPIIGEVRMAGMLGALELVQTKNPLKRFSPEKHAGSVFVSVALSNGIIVRAPKDTITLCPPLTISKGEIDFLIERIRRSLNQTADLLRV